MDDRTRILNMVSEGKLTVDEAEKLLDALGAPKSAPETPALLKDTRGRKPTKLRINVDTPENSKSKAKVNVNIPLSIVRTLGPVIVKNLPKEAKDELDKSGVDIVSIISDIETIIAEASEEDIINVDAYDGEDGAKVRVYLE